MIDDIPIKHKFAMNKLNPSEPIWMYGAVIGKVISQIEMGEIISTSNVRHGASSYNVRKTKIVWDTPEPSKWNHTQFMGYHRTG